MVGYLLNACYAALLVGLSPYLLYAAIRKGKYRAGWSTKILGRVPYRSGNQTCIWLHAVSVGEVQLLDALIQEIRLRNPSIDCVISTTTRTGYALATKKYAGHLVFYCPLDFTWSTTAAIQRIRPDLLVLAELELWPNLLGAARRHGARVAVVNGRLSEKSFRGYRRIRPFIGTLLRSIDLIAVQDAEYARRFEQLGAETGNLRVTGSVKFDGARSDRRNPQTSALAALAHFHDEDVVLLAGSTQRPEETLAIDTFCQLRDDYPQLRLVLVPRHPERFEEVAGLLNGRGLTWQRRSRLADEAARYPDPRILLVDTVGELGSWWGTADIGFVGGSLGSRGGQNMIEPAAYGLAVCFGPNTQNFRDVASALLSHDAARVVTDGASLTAFVRRCLEQPEYARHLGSRAAELVANSRGATALTIDHILQLLPASQKIDNPSRSAA